MELNFEKICRVCLTEGEIMMSLFKVNVSRKIMSCASVQVWPNDNLPHQICQKCCAKLHVAFQFKRLCEKSDSKLRTFIIKSGKLKTKEKEQYQEQQNCLNKEHKLVKQHEELQQQIQHNALHIQQPQSNCLFVECNGDVIDVPIQDQSFIQNGQSVQQTISAPMNTYNNMSQAPIQIGNYNIQNVIYSTTYPVTLQTLQHPNNLVHSQVVTSIPLQTQSLHHTPQNVEQSTMDPLVKNNNIQTNLISQKAKDEEKKHENPNQCSICLKIFPNSTKKNRHMKIHSKSDMPYKCSVCNKEFMHGGNYKIHMRMHNNEKPFSCTVCPKRFVQAQDLEKHMRTHTGERPHKCTMCWKAFSTGSNLIAHIRTHTGERPYVCSVCSKAFCQSNELTKHMRTHTGEKSHICDICNKGFNGSSTLIVHKRSHTGEKPFTCKICNKSFTQSGCLSAHLKRYGESKYSCEICKVAFHSDKVLQEHEKTTEHNDNVYKCQTQGQTVGIMSSEFEKHRIREHINPLVVDGR